MRQPFYRDLEDVKEWGPWRPREEGPIWVREQKVQRPWSWDKVCLACYGRNNRKIWMARQRWKREGGVETGWNLRQFNILLPYWVMCNYWGIHITPKWEEASNLHVMYLVLQPCWLFLLSPPHLIFSCTVGFWRLTCAPFRCLAYLDSLTCGSLWEATGLPRHLVKNLSALYSSKEGYDWDSANTCLSSPWHLLERMEGQGEG